MCHLLNFSGISQSVDRHFFVIFQAVIKYLSVSDKAVVRGFSGSCHNYVALKSRFFMPFTIITPKNTEN